MSHTIALAIPHTPWIPERVESMRRLCTGLFMPTDLQVVDGSPVEYAQAFTQRAPNWEWSVDLWNWGRSLGTNITHLLQLQDDVIPAPNFWPALHAMLKALPEEIIGLQGAHPVFRLLARDGFRWARSRAWMVGVGYIIPRPVLEAMLEWRRHLPEEEVQKTNEDELIARFCRETSRHVWHPIPTIIDHDTDVPSTYGHEGHMYRRPTVTWRDFGAKEIEDPAFWKVPDLAPMVRNPHGEACWFCQHEPACIAVEETGAKMGKQCLAKVMTSLIGRLP